MGKIELDHTGSGGGVTLSSDGTDLLLDGTAIGGGGGGADLYAANEVSVTAQPSATGDDAIAIGDSAVASGANALAGPISQASGANSFAAAIGSTSTSWGAKADYGVALGFEARVQTGATGGAALGYEADCRGQLGVAIGQGAYVTVGGIRAVAIGYQAEAGAQNSFAAGDAPVIGSSGTSSVALGTSYANGVDSFAAAITNNTSSYGATGANSVAIGYQAKATNADAIAFGDTSTASGGNSFAHGRSSIANSSDSVAIGIGATSTASRSFSFGDNCVASASYSFSIGRSTKSSYNYSYAFGYNTEATRKGVLVYGGGQFSAKGDAQCGTMVLRRATTDATATVLTSDGSTPAGVNEVQLPNNSAYAFHGTIVARESATDGTDCAAWKVEGLIRREGSAGTTVLVNSATTVLDNTPSWGLALSADTTNGGLKIEATGAASTNIRWVATIHTSEVTYA